MGSALGSYTPRIVIDHTPLAIGSAGTTDLTVSFDRNDDATAKATIYGAPEYAGVTLDQAPGTQLGTVAATVIAKQISPTPLPLRGTIKADDPLKYVSNPCAPGIHAVVLLLALQAAGRELDVPVYVDPTAGAEAALGSVKLQLCLPSPDVPEASGGPPFGSKLISATLHLKNVFVLPAQAGSYAWTVVATPYLPGTATPDPAGTVQARGFVKLPAQLSLKAKVEKKLATLAGALKLNLTGLAGMKVTLLSGSSRTKLTAAGSATTRAAGAFSFKNGLAKATYFRAQVTAPARSTTCTGGVPGIPCVGATLNPFTVQSAIVKATPKKR